MPPTRLFRPIPLLLLGGGLAAVPVSAPAQCPATQTRYDIVDLGTLGGGFSAALDVDDAGRVVGAAWTVEGYSHPFLWENGVMTDLGTLGGDSGYSASGINAVGEVTGQGDNAQNARRAFLWANGVMVELPMLAGIDGRGHDINDLGQVVGISNAGLGQHGFLYDSDTGALTDLGVALAGDTTSFANAINESGQIAAWSGPSAGVTGARAYLYENGVWTPLGTLGGTRSVAWGMDDSGRVVGWSDVAGDAGDHPFVWAGGVMSDLGTLGGSSGVAAGAHASGPVVGYSTISDGRQHAFVHAGAQLADLNMLIPSGTGWELDFALAVNAAGQIVGRGAIGGENHAYLATPATLAVDKLSDLVESFGLPDGIENSLLAKLNDVLAALENCTPTAACAPLGAFVNQVKAQSGKALTTQQADALLASAAELQAVLGCP